MLCATQYAALCRAPPRRAEHGVPRSESAAEAESPSARTPGAPPDAFAGALPGANWPRCLLRRRVSSLRAPQRILPSFACPVISGVLRRADAKGHRVVAFRAC